MIALGRIKSPEAIDPLIERCCRTKIGTRLTAAAALKAIEDERGRKQLSPAERYGYGGQDADSSAFLPNGRSNQPLFRQPGLTVG